MTSLVHWWLTKASPGEECEESTDRLQPPETQSACQPPTEVTCLLHQRGSGQICNRILLESSPIWQLFPLLLSGPEKLQPGAASQCLARSSAVTISILWLHSAHFLPDKKGRIALEFSWSRPSKDPDNLGAVSSHHFLRHTELWNAWFEAV